MKRPFTRTIAFVAALLFVLCSFPAVTASAATSYPNTHTNTGDQAADIVAVAMTQVGYCEGSLSGNPAYAGSNNYQKFGQWYDANVDNIGGTYAAWCAMFVSWCANQANIPSSTCYYHAYCPYGVNWYKNKGLFYSSKSRGGSYTPKAGDIIYFQSSSSSVATHVGIVRYSSGGYVYTVEGNTSGQKGEVNNGGGVFAKSYSLSYANILGYGTPNYESSPKCTVSFNSNGGTAVSSKKVEQGSAVAAPSNPSRYAFNFVGWYCNPELTDPYDFSKPVNYDFTLYAKWEEAYWSAHRNLTPNTTDLHYNEYESGGRVFAYENSTDNSIDMYQGADSDNNWAWPSAYITYENSFDAANDAYVYIRKDGTAHFNAIVTYLDQNGTAHDAILSEIAGVGSDFEPGYLEVFVNLGNYIAQQGHIPASGNVKYTKVTYFITGPKDSYVKVYDMQLTPEFAIDDPYASFLTPDSDIAQDGDKGCFAYENGVLNISGMSNGAYTVTLPVNVPFDPSVFSKLMTDLTATTRFNITLHLTNANGNASVELRNEFFDKFGLSAVPSALPAGHWIVNDMNLKGYYEWNGGVIKNSIVKSVTITVYGTGDLSIAALQATRKNSIVYVSNTIRQSGEINEDTPTLLTSVAYTVTDDSISRVTLGTTAAAARSHFDQKAEYIIFYTANGSAVSDNDTLKTGMRAVLTVSGKTVRSYGIAVTGDIRGNGIANSASARDLLQVVASSKALTPLQLLAADYDGNGGLNTTDVRRLLHDVVGN
ncbi:MAG: InlB B-repeat-containing protein [Clostridia bacterium]|nr:InlB B-repeat-containing protein [Clostridia bacterium]